MWNRQFESHGLEKMSTGNGGRKISGYAGTNQQWEFEINHLE
jgi:hypothetical protein